MDYNRYNVACYKDTKLWNCYSTAVASWIIYLHIDFFKGIEEESFLGIIFVSKSK